MSYADPSEGAAVDPEPEPELRAVADELRAAIERLTDRHVDPAAAERALGHARALLAELEGPRRQRWYETDAQTPIFARARPYFEKMSPFRGRLNPLAVPFEVEWAREGEPRIIGRITLPRSYEGPPHAVHGGVVAGLFDDLLGGVQALTPPVGMTAKLSVTYRSPTPVETPLVFEGWVHDNGATHMRAKGTCHAGDRLTAEATALFIRVDFDEVEERGRNSSDEGVR